MVENPSESYLSLSSSSVFLECNSSETYENTICTFFTLAYSNDSHEIFFHVDSWSKNRLPIHRLSTHLQVPSVP